jgi:signal transduction histidine kinase
MKLVQKLTIALLGGITATLAANGYFRVRREVALFESSHARDHRLIGRALGVAVADVWRAQGEEAALHVIERANAEEGKVRIRWAHDEKAARESATEENRTTYVPVVVGDAVMGSLELYESRSVEREYIRTTIVDTVLTTTLLVVICAGLSGLLGAWLVGRPVRAIADKARRVGRGDFSGPLTLPPTDELGELAVEMNAMCDQLVVANAKVASETQARIVALEQLRHADRLMTVGKLASGIAHELGTPLNVIGARAEMIASRETTLDEAADYARVIVESCERVTRIIRQLLEFARRKGPQKAHKDLYEIATRTAELLRPLAAKKSIELVVARPAEPPTVDADAAQIQQVVTNLVVNAVQATRQPGRVEIEVDTRTATPPAGREPHAPGRYRVLSVTDRGHGIAPENLPHVFEPFFTTKDVGEGTGLGLAVAYGIVEEHGGFIRVESEVGKGSRFSVYLPLPAIVAERTQEPEAAASASSGAPSPSS